jgi:hypothetical protein
MCWLCAIDYFLHCKVDFRQSKGTYSLTCFIYFMQVNFIAESTFKLYAPSAQRPFISTCSRTTVCAAVIEMLPTLTQTQRVSTNLQLINIITAPLVNSALDNILWSDSSFGYFTQLHTCAHHEWMFLSLTVIFETSGLLFCHAQRTDFPLTIHSAV